MPFCFIFLIMSCFLKYKAFLYALPPVMISSPKRYSHLSSMLICYTGCFSFCQSVFFHFFQKYKFLPQIVKAGPSFRQSCSYNPYSVLYNVSALCASVFMLFLPSIASRAEARWKYRSYFPLLALKIKYDHWKRHRQYHLENHEHNCYSSHGADRNHAIFPVSKWADDERAEKIYRNNKVNMMLTFAVKPYIFFYFSVHF